MTKDTLQVDKTLFLKIAKGYDTLKKQVDHLESHLHDDLAPDAPVPPKGFFCNVEFNNTIPIAQRPAFTQQFQAEMMSVLKQYGVQEFEGTYSQ